MKTTRVLLSNLETPPTRGVHTIQFKAKSGTTYSEMSSEFTMVYGNPTNYLTFTGNKGFSFSNAKLDYDGVLIYSYGAGNTWRVWKSNTTIASSSNKILVAGIGNTYVKGTINGGLGITSNSGNKISITGRIDTLLDCYTIDDGQQPTMANGAFTYTFCGCAYITNTPSFPTNITQSCYYGCFRGCTDLTTVATLPAQRLPTSCYNTMFFGCSSLTTVNQFTAIEYGNSCCFMMFGSCTSLTRSVRIGAGEDTTFGAGALSHMYNSCTSLNTLGLFNCKNLPANVCSTMFLGCSSLLMSNTQQGSYIYSYRLPNISGGTGGNQSGMFPIGTGVFGATYYLQNAPI